jgi:hypothetical protein
MSRALRALASTLVAVLATAASFAAPSAVDSAGKVHDVEEVLWSNGARVGGTALRYIVQDPDGSSRAEIVPGTDDMEIDHDPSLVLDPITEQPILVWSRNQGGDYEIRLCRRDDTGWRPPIAIASEPGDQVEPQVFARRELIHVVWTTRFAGSGETHHRRSLWRSTLATAVGPEELPRTTATVIPEDGGTDADPASSTDDLTYFGAAIDRGSSDDATIVVWGIRDEPLPITYVRAFAVGHGADGIRDVAAGILGGRLVTWFVAAGAVHYTVREDGRWSDFRLIVLDDETDVPDAIRLVEQRNRRDALRSATD